MGASIFKQNRARQCQAIFCIAIIVCLCSACSSIAFSPKDASGSTYEPIALQSNEIDINDSIDINNFHAAIRVPKDGCHFTVQTPNNKEWWICSVSIESMSIDLTDTTQKRHKNKTNCKKFGSSHQKWDWYDFRVTDGNKLNCKINRNNSEEYRMIHITMSTGKIFKQITIKQPCN